MTSPRQLASYIHHRSSPTIKVKGKHQKFTVAERMMLLKWSVRPRCVILLRRLADYQDKTRVMAF